MHIYYSMLYTEECPIKKLHMHVHVGYMYVAYHLWYEGDQCDVAQALMKLSSTRQQNVMHRTCIHKVPVN